ncbi:MAG: stage III sporulation AC/AD family protein [Vescimonas sp.]|uniref:stage III sporulation AC/AD family protein n=1 Tax=Vescimonas sp. TaxID=2892404 RepID=UPI002A919F57|nr:stage III sporulation AC/AD family protein [Vescimonas sp.]MDY5333858.1 stage III sporulation AC/AD family protein [Vescimonas sp.]
MRLTALCLVGALLAALLRRTGGEMALLLALAVCGAAVMLLAQPLEELKGFWEEAASWGQLPVQLFVPLVKTVGIALICRTGSDLCRDAGESAIGSVLETAGAVAAIVVSLPLFRSAWELLRSLV